nr:hypothetical protein [Streptomyces sp. NA04227]
MDPSSLESPSTKRSVRAASGTLYELRYSSTAACAWGRIQYGHMYDELWVDRARSLTDANAGRWEPQLGWMMLGTDTWGYTPAYDDDGMVMRACGRSWGQVVCTGWY